MTMISPRLSVLEQETDSADPSISAASIDALPIISGPLHGPIYQDDRISFGAVSVRDRVVLAPGNEGRRAPLASHYDLARGYLSRSPEMRSVFLALEDGTFMQRSDTREVFIDVPSVQSAEQLQAFIRDQPGYKKNWVQRMLAGCFGLQSVAENVTSSSSASLGDGIAAIHWDPHAGSALKNGSAHSPALALGHEATHVLHYLEDPAAFAKRLSTPDAAYHNKEERLTQILERRTARDLGEGERSSHNDGFTVPVITCTSAPTAAARQFLNARRNASVKQRVIGCILQAL